MKKLSFLVLPIITLGLLHLGMGRGDAQYDLDAREQEKIEKEQEKVENAGKSFGEKIKEAAKGDSNEKTLEIVPPKAKSDDTSQIKFKIPGT